MKIIDKQKFSEWLSVLKKEYGISRSKIAKEVGVSPQYLNNIVNQGSTPSNEVYNSVYELYKKIIEDVSMVREKESDYQTSKPRKNIPLFDSLTSQHRRNTTVYIDVSTLNGASSADFAVTTTDNLLAPEVKKNDRLFFTRYPAWAHFDSEEIFLFQLNQISVIGYVMDRKENDFYLKLSNQPTVIKRYNLEDIELIFKCLSILRVM